jgi:glycine oxidase
LRSSSVVVVGGGVIGCSVAYQLAKAGATTTLIERDPIGSHASGRNPGNLNPLLGAEPGLVPLALESLRLHRALAYDLAPLGCTSYRIEPVRRLLVAFGDADRAELDRVEREIAPYPGFATRRLNGRELRSIEPRLSEAIREGLLIEGNESLDSLTFTRALAEAAQDSGASFVRARATGVRQDGSRAVRAVSTESGEHPCDALVLATGPWVSETRDWLGIDLPVEPVKGEMLRMRLRGGNITHDFTHGLISLYRRGDDEAWVGVTRERCGFDETPTERGRQALLDGAARIMPAVRGATLVEAFAALRPATTTGLPIVGRAPGWDNVFVANGGGIKGMLLSTGIGIAIRDLIVAGKTSMPVADFVPRGAH